MATQNRKSRSTETPQEQAAILQAIESANADAGRDNEKFIAALNQHFRGSKQKSTGDRAVIPVQPVERPTRSFQIFKDPRYLANARELARRTQGGVRVLGGQKVKAGEFLDCVAVGSDSQWGCTGTLVAANVVVTAGHCADFATRVFFGGDVTKPGKVVQVKKRVRHPQYHKGKHNDLLVLILAENVSTVSPRKFATKALADSATDGRVVGFGTINASGTFGYGVKRFVDIPIVSNACRGTVDGQDDKVTYGCDLGVELVAGRPLLERDSCKGDSGGPFYILGKDNAWVLAGATSRATDSAMHECGDGGIYARVDQYRVWINSLPGVALP
jgi:secreted trypsin-like serine protease